MRKLIAYIAGLLLMGGVLFGLWKGVAYFFSLLSSASPEVAAAVVGGMFTAFVAIVAALLAHRSARVRASEDAHRVKKVEIYRDFLNMVARLMVNENAKVNLKPLEEEELITYLVEFMSDVMLWGSPSVLNAIRNFKAQGHVGGAAMFKAVEDLYRAIRSDIGLSNKGLEPYALVKMYLKDPSELDTFVADTKSRKTNDGKAGSV